MGKRLLIVSDRNGDAQKIAQGIEQATEPIRKVANVYYTPKTIIVPTGYIECPWMHQHIISLQQSADKVLFLVSLQNTIKKYPPKFAQVFKLSKIGAITYNSEKVRNKTADLAEKELRELGIEGPFIKVNLNEMDSLFQLPSKLNRKEEKYD